MNERAQKQSDLESCAQEPIHIPGAIQPHGALLVLDPASFSVLQASANASNVLGAQVGPDIALSEILPDYTKQLETALSSGEGSFQQAVEIGGKWVNTVAHSSDGFLIFEVESLPIASDQVMGRLFPRLRLLTDALSTAEDLLSIANVISRHVRHVTGFDRVLVYQFDNDWNGHVIGEDGNGVLPSYLGLRFPAGDIPAQARQLYLLNRVRIIPNVDYAPVPIMPASNPVTGQSVDLSFSLLRSVSPIHLEYMRNMGTAASMSVSIIVDGELWGLVSCHSKEPHLVSLDVRDACDFAVQSMAIQVGGRTRSDDAVRRVQLSEVSARLLSAMTDSSDWKHGLFSREDDLLNLLDATGAALVLDDECWRLGVCPEKTQVRAIVDWLEQEGETDVFLTNGLAARRSDFQKFADIASGLVAIRISELHPSWMLWFRPEVIRTVTWGGNPHKVVREAGRIHPRVSFDAWKEMVRNQARAWQSAEIEAARDLRTAIVGIVLRRAEELAQLTQKLQRANRELEAFSYSISHDLRAPFRHIVGFSELLREREENLDDKSIHYLDCIADSAISAGRLIDDLLNFSHLGRTALVPSRVDMNKLVTEVRRTLALATKERQIGWDVEKLPSTWGDGTLLRQVWFNLIDNAIKYTRNQDGAKISITGWTEDQHTKYAIKDNGVGFDITYADKLFGVFQRLHRVEDFEGTGIGLALTKRIVERHGGRIWAESELDKGAKFIFQLPIEEGGKTRA